MPEASVCGKKTQQRRFYVVLDRHYHLKPTPEETTEKLMEVSSQAKENSQDYAIGQAMEPDYQPSYDLEHHARAQGFRNAHR